MKASIRYLDYLKKRLKVSPDEAIGYLNAALEDGDPRVFLLALKDVAEAWGGLSKLARATKLHRVNLHRMLSKKGNPEFQSLHRLLQALGLRLQIASDKPLKKAA